MLERNYKRCFVLIFPLLSWWIYADGVSKHFHCKGQPDWWKYRFAPWSNRVWWRSGGLSRTVADFIWHKVRTVNRNLLLSGWSASVEGEKLSSVLGRLNHVLNWDLFIKFSPTFFARAVLNMSRIFDCLFMEIPIEILLRCYLKKIYKKIVYKWT